MKIRRNQTKTPPLPEGWELLAVSYGTGSDDYLAIVLAYNETKQEYVTWVWNSAEGCIGVGQGHYFNHRSYKNAPNAMESAAHNAIIDFQQRSYSFLSASYQWVDEGVNG